MSFDDDPDDEKQGEERQSFEFVLAGVATRFINIPADQVDGTIEIAQRRICEFLGLDLCTLWQIEEDNPCGLVLTHYYRALDGPPPPARMDASEYFPYHAQRSGNPTQTSGRNSPLRWKPGRSQEVTNQ